MRRLPALALIVLSVAALAACSASAAPGWTYAPAASATPVASGAASGAPSGGPSVAPSSAASSAPSVAPSAGESPAGSGGGGTGATLTVTAKVSAAVNGFDEKTLETAAGSPFTLIFDNQDNTAPHNLVLFNPDGSKVTVQGDTAFFTGPGQRTYQVPALTAGAYTYKCEIHPSTMVGTLNVK